MSHGEEGVSVFLKTRSNASELLELVEKAFGDIAFGIFDPVINDDFAPVAAPRDDRSNTVQSKYFTDTIGIVAFIQGG